MKATISVKDKSVELHELIYSSLAERDMPTAELAAMLDQSREKNTKLRITGLLVYRRQEFTQILEGDKADILSLYSTICQDKRHRAPHLLWAGPIEQRSFADWSMAFLAPTDAALQGKPAYSSYFQTGLAEKTLRTPKSIGRRMFLTHLRDDFLNT